MKNPLQIAVLAGVMFIGPNSEALLSNAALFDMENAGFHCVDGQEYRQVNIKYKPHNLFIKTCDITYSGNNRQEQLLWATQRNSSSCETKAAAVAQRLEDRGWQCKTAGW